MVSSLQCTRNSELTHNLMPFAELYIAFWWWWIILRWGEPRNWNCSLRLGISQLVAANNLDNSSCLFDQHASNIKKWVLFYWHHFICVNNTNQVCQGYRTLTYSDLKHSYSYIQYLIYFRMTEKYLICVIACALQTTFSTNYIDWA